MSLSMHQASVPVFLRALDNLHVVLVKGAAHAKSKNVSDAVMLGTRLIPDMYPLSRQVQIACDIACRGAARLGMVGNVAVGRIGAAVDGVGAAALDGFVGNAGLFKAVAGAQNPAQAQDQKDGDGAQNGSPARRPARTSSTSPRGALSSVTTNMASPCSLTRESCMLLMFTPASPRTVPTRPTAPGLS